MNKAHTNEDILEKLQGYSDLKRKESLLSFELDNYIVKISNDDIIETMSFGDGLHEHVSGGQISDRTANTALSYAKRVEIINIKAIRDLETELRYIRLEIKRLTYYVDLLDARLANVIRTHYFEGYNSIKTIEKLGLSPATFKRSKSWPYQNSSKCIILSFLNTGSFKDDSMARISERPRVHPLLAP